MAYQIIASASRNFMSSNIQKFKNLNFGQNWEVHYFRLDFWVAPPTKKRPHLMECWDMSTRCFALLSLVNLEVKDECSKNDLYLVESPLWEIACFFCMFFYPVQSPPTFLIPKLEVCRSSIQSYDTYDAIRSQITEDVVDLYVPGPMLYFGKYVYPKRCLKFVLIQTRKTYIDL